MTDQVRRGTVISFDPTLWQAAILLDGADVEATLPVGQWVSADTMAVDSPVAVLVFGETDTNDGVVLGPYGALGSAGIPTFAGLTVTGSETVNALNIGAATGAAAGEMRASIFTSQQLPFSSFAVLASNMTATGSNPYACSIKAACTIIDWDQGWAVTTPNDASNYWTIKLCRIDNNATIATFNTSAGAGSTWLRAHIAAINFSLTPAMVGMYITCTKSGSPGPLSLLGPAVYVM
jgi:hypothetical protein